MKPLHDTSLALGPGVHRAWGLLSVVDQQELGDRIDRALGERPGLRVGRTELIAAALEVAQRRAGVRGDSLLATVPPFLGDFALAVVCRRRPPDEEAWRVVIAEYRTDLLRTASDLGEPVPDDAVCSFFGDLWVVRPSGRSLLDTYEGLGPLSAWLGLVFRRRVLASRDGQLRTSLPADRASEVEGPAERLARDEEQRGLRLVLERCLAPLSGRDRLLLEARVLDREQGVVTARRLGVSPAYVSRRFKEVVLGLRTRLGPWLDRRGLGPEDLT